MAPVHPHHSCEEGVLLEKMTDQEIWGVANSIMDNLMDASTQKDHSRHVRDFTVRIRNIVTPDHFERICKQYQTDKGFFTTRAPLSIFRRPTSVALIWRQQFSKISGDYVAEIVLIQQEGKFLVDHVMVF